MFVIRIFILFFVGIVKMNFVKFCIYIVFGLFFWCLFFVYFGKKFGDNWKLIEEYLKGFDYFILVLIIVVIVGYVVYKIFKGKKLVEVE